MTMKRKGTSENVCAAPPLNKRKSLNNENKNGYVGEVGKLALPKRDNLVKHYSCSHQILLVGDGDFSFSLSLALSFGSAFNICATSLDSREELVKKYRQVGSNLEQLWRLGATILHGVDATKMVHCSQLKYKKFDRIVFNFPHAGFYGQEANPHMIKMHKDLVHGFFSNARWLLRQNGEVHVTHKDSAPYCDWNLEELACESGLRLVERVPFNKDDYPHYQNKRGQGLFSDKSFMLGECSTYKFIASSDSTGMFNFSPRRIISTDVAFYETTPNILLRRGSFIPTELEMLRFVVKGLVDLYTGQATYTGALTDSRTMRAFISGPLTEFPMRPNVAELIAIKNALLMFERSNLCGKASVVVESDSICAVSWIKSELEKPWDVMPHVLEIKMALARIRDADICCSFVMDGVKTHQLVVHELAKRRINFRNEVEFWF